MGAMLTIVSKVGVMLILILVGYFVTKKRMLTDRGTGEINTLLLQIVIIALANAVWVGLWFVIVVLLLNATQGAAAAAFAAVL